MTIRERCEECEGRTVEARGSGKDTQWKLCRRWKEPGHKTEAEVRQELAAWYVHAAPSGRFA